jgi:polyhydroxyalkanoate synthesis regulator phasin
MKISPHIDWNSTVVSKLILRSLNDIHGNQEKVNHAAEKVVDKGKLNA